MLRSSLALLLLTLAAPVAAESITGVCPDGSIFIVHRAADIPCSAAKRVEPHDVPPLNPDFLPRPYGWEVFNRQNNPNNPYNLVDAARAQRGEPPAPTTPGPPQPPAPLPPTTNSWPIAPSLPPPTPRVAALPRPTPAPGAGADLGLGSAEVRDLGLIVKLMQERAPATVAVHDGEGGLVMAIRVARSPAFEQRLRAALTARGTPVAPGPVILFTAVADGAASFYGNLTFVQGHVAFHPEPSNPAQFGVLDGRLGPLAAGQSVLGYAVLPPHVDVALPLDIYWNDRQVTATLSP